eukprot:scaffold138548_cov24-Tisochrysis_lutea.AAC.3
MPPPNPAPPTVDLSVCIELSGVEDAPDALPPRGIRFAAVGTFGDADAESERRRSKPTAAPPTAVSAQLPLGGAPFRPSFPFPLELLRLRTRRPMGPASCSGDIFHTASRDLNSGRKQVMALLECDMRKVKRASSPTGTEMLARKGSAWIAALPVAPAVGAAWTDGAGGAGGGAGGFGRATFGGRGALVFIWERGCEMEEPSINSLAATCSIESSFPSLTVTRGDVILEGDDRGGGGGGVACFVLLLSGLPRGRVSGPPPRRSPPAARNPTRFIVIFPASSTHVSGPLERPLHAVAASPMGESSRSLYTVVSSQCAVLSNVLRLAVTAAT